MAKIRLMIVDDSATIRQVLSSVLNQQPDIEVIATAPDPIFAYDKMQKDWPDVLLLDIEMPRMDGLTFLRQLMKEHPIPVVVFSTLTEKGTATAMRALATGAVGVIAKPTSGLKQFLEQHSEGLIQHIRAAAAVTLKNLAPVKHKAFASQARSSVITQVQQRAITASAKIKRPLVIAIGASTGGPQAIESLLTTLPATTPGIVIVQHMPQNFTEAFARRLNDICQLKIKEAETGDVVLPGHVYIAPGGRHMQIREMAHQLFIDIQSGPHVNRHCPSVDILFKSVAGIVADRALGIILTGMGNDGARGLKQMRDRGAVTVAEDEQSCVVYGMPKEAIKIGGASLTLTLPDIKQLLLEL